MTKLYFKRYIQIFTKRNIKLTIIDKITYSYVLPY